MKGSEFLRKVRALARRKGLRCEWVAEHGNGSPGRLYFERRFTTVKDLKKEIGKGLLRAMCEELGIDPNEL